jgi:uncharacterized protein
VILGMITLSVILIGIIIHLDHRAVMDGKIGFMEMTSGKTSLENPAEVEKAYLQVMSRFGVKRRHLIHAGTVNSKTGSEELQHRIFRVEDADQWLKILNEIEVHFEQAGLIIHNRFTIKTHARWQYTLFIGPVSGRTHKIEIRFHPQKSRREMSRSESEPDPVETDGAKIGLVFDDFGYDMAIADRFITELNVPVTLAVIPFLSHSADIVQAVNKTSHSVFLHLPLEPLDSGAMGSEIHNFLTSGMDDGEILAKLDEMFQSLPEVDGVNNHMGSRMTADRNGMHIILSDLKKRSLPFLDSRTSADSIAADVAADIGLQHASRHVFLDQGYKGGNVTENLNKLIKVAQDKGFAIGIGHARPETLEAVKRSIPSILESGVRIVPVVDLMGR